MEPKTPLPWVNHEHLILTKDNLAVAVCESRRETDRITLKQGAGDARFIVHAANLHKRLVEFVKDVGDSMLECNDDECGECEDCKMYARRAELLKEAGQ